MLETRPGLQRSLDVPIAVRVGDTVYIDTKKFQTRMERKGWNVKIMIGIGGDLAKDGYHLSIGLQTDLDIEASKRKIGITNEEGRDLKGYFLRSTSNGEERRLIFNFIGVPSEETVRILGNLDAEFSPLDHRSQPFFEKIKTLIQFKPQR